MQGQRYDIGLPEYYLETLRDFGLRDRSSLG
jgi:UTP-glucose-1-phosphate uridylyltransferase